MHWNLYRLTRVNSSRVREWEELHLALIPDKGTVRNLKNFLPLKTVQAPQKEDIATVGGPNFQSNLGKQKLVLLILSSLLNSPCSFHYHLRYQWWGWQQVQTSKFDQFQLSSLSFEQTKEAVVSKLFWRKSVNLKDDILCSGSYLVIWSQFHLHVDWF